MNTSELFSTVGLLLDMIGVGLIFFFGISSVFELSGHQMIVTKEQNNLEVKKEARFKRYSRIGLILIFLGFSFQIIGNFL